MLIYDILQHTFFSLLMMIQRWKSQNKFLFLDWKWRTKNTDRSGLTTQVSSDWTSQADTLFIEKNGETPNYAQSKYKFFYMQYIFLISISKIGSLYIRNGNNLFIAERNYSGTLCFFISMFHTLSGKIRTIVSPPRGRQLNYPQSRGAI